VELFTISAEPERVVGGGEETRPEVQASMPESTAQPGARQPQPTALEERKSPLAASTVTTVQGSDAVRLSGVSEAINQQIAKYDSSEFDDDKETVGTDAEGVWAPEIEQSFQEALAIYPPCGRRKIILSDEGKMYGRNELIARYIKLRTAKTRTRKQVSSHIQVLARRKLREIQAKLKVPNQSNTSSFPDQSHKEKAIQQMQQMSSAQIVSASAMHKQSLLPVQPGSQVGGAGSVASYAGQFWQPALNSPPEDVKPFQSGFPLTAAKTSSSSGSSSPWLGRSIATHKLRLLEHSAYVEQTACKHHFVHIGSSSEFSDPVLEPVDVRQIQDKFPEKSGGLKELYEKGPQDAFFLVKFWADLNTNVNIDDMAFYGATTTYESKESMTIQCSTKVCSFVRSKTRGKGPERQSLRIHLKVKIRPARVTGGWRGSRRLPCPCHPADSRCRSRSP